MAMCRNRAGCTFKGVALLVLVIDIITKMLARRHQPSGSGVISIDYTTNTGAAFGMMKEGNVLLIMISIAVLAAIIYMMFFSRKRPSMGTAVFLGLLAGGALGNLLDRIFFGFVTDFISFSFWPAFNVADIAITTGVIGLVVIIMKE